MKSIKPGRGPSMMGGIMSICMGIFGVLWTVAVASVGGGFMALFGVVFIVIAIVQAVYHFTNARSKNRFSTFDITEESEEPDPWNARFGESPQPAPPSESAGYCPYCGAKVESGYVYCRKCGKKLS